MPSLLASHLPPTPCDVKPAGYQAAPSKESEQRQGPEDLQSISGQIYTPALPVHYGLWYTLPHRSHDSGISNSGPDVSMQLLLKDRFGNRLLRSFWETLESQPSLAGCPPGLCSHVTVSP